MVMALGLAGYEEGTLEREGDSDRVSRGKGSTRMGVEEVGTWAVGVSDSCYKSLSNWRPGTMSY